MYRQQQPRQHGHLDQYGQNRGSFAAQMPPPSMHHPARLSTGMGLGFVAEDEAGSDFILDDLDRLSSRDVAMARYKRNHDLLAMIFDARRIDTLEPPASAYAHVDQADLGERLQGCEEEISKVREFHAKRIKTLKDAFARQDVALPEANQEAETSRADEEEAAPEEEGGAEEEALEWASRPSEGDIVGVGYVRAKTPEEVRALLPRAPEPPAAPLPPPAQAVPAPVLQQVEPLLNDQTDQVLDAVGSVQDTSMAVEADSGDEDGEDDDDDDEEEEEGDEGDDDNEDDDDDEDAEGEDGEGEGEDGVRDADADADADADGDEDADAEDDAGAIEEKPVTGSAAEEVESMSRADEDTIAVEHNQQMLEPAAGDTVMDEVVQPEPKDEEEAHRMGKEREMVEEVNRQHGVLGHAEGPTDVSGEAAEANSVQLL